MFARCFRLRSAATSVLLAIPLVSVVSRAPSRDSVVYKQETDGFRTFRIPSLVLAMNGSLVALAEGRVRVQGPQVSCRGPRNATWQPEGNNTCCYGVLASVYDGMCFDKDIVVRTSHDGGRTWGLVKTLTKSNSSFFYSNAIGLTDPATSRIWIMFSRCTVSAGYGGCRDVWMFSDSHGETWEAADHLDKFGSQGLGGVGSGIVLRHGRHAGTLVFVKGWLMYSSDHGKTWHEGASTNGGSGEGQCAEVADGGIICATRSGWMPKITMSVDGGRTFSSGYYLDGSGGHSNMTDDDCALSLAASTFAGTSLFLAHPNRMDYIGRRKPDGRQNVTVSRAVVLDSSYIEWRDYVQVYEGPSAYTALGPVDHEGRECAVLYERSPVGFLPVSFESINIAVFPCEPKDLPVDIDAVYL